jgi:hypothetical protein
MATPTIVYLEDETIIEKCSHGFKMVTGILTFGAYETGGGVAFDLSQRLPTKVHQVIIEPKGGYVPVYNYDTEKIVVYVNRSDTAVSPLIELTAATDLATPMADTRFTAIGK